MRYRTQVANEPSCCKLCGLLERPWFAEQVSCTGYDLQLALRCPKQLVVSDLIKFDHLVVVPADEQQGCCADAPQRGTSEIGSASSRNNCHDARLLRGRDERGGRSGTGAKIA